MESIGTQIQPVISWSGNRYEIAQRVQDKFPLDFGTYYEPMIGSASVFFKSRHYPAVIGDKNQWLVDMYWAIKDDYLAVVKILESLTPCREVYNRVRQINPDHIFDVSFRAAHLIFLNRLCFGRTFRTNKQGKFNISFGRLQSVYTEENLKAVSEALNGVKLECGDFEETIESAKKNDFIYFDPPCPEKRVFGYHRNERDTFEFTQKDYLRLIRACIDLDKRGIKWAVTDNNTSLIRLYLHGFCVTELVRSKEDNEIEVVLITNYQT